MKKMRFVYRISILLVLCSCVSACDSWPADIIAEIDQESKDYCLFAKNSYWVYQNSITLEVDSVIIHKVTYEKETHATPTQSFGYEEYTMTLAYFLKNYNNMNWDGSYLLTSATCDENNIEDGIIKYILLEHGKGINGKYFAMDPNYVINYAYTDYNNGELYEQPYWGTGGSYYENYYESYQIGDKNFSKVKVFLSSFPENNLIRTYWAKNIGIIRTEYIGEDSCVFAVRNLIRYNVKH